ncbi:hypothetical protein [Oceanicoccus sp. KOV_DT_Chl]|uniref:hypothetical protein n=1 Tax=Oceanicoccus sp. KOV_DT_Chl TaxID=1904639 RepID=UPI000C7A2611|nr:hypothetical protein [Oceanicoccus sp. KOV_DT_Chl]
MTDTTLNSPEQTLYPYRIWWGVLACILIMGVIIALAPYNDGIVFAVDQGGWWYLWQLPDPSVWTRLSAWGGYALHQLTIWWLIWYAQSSKLKYVQGLHPVNFMALMANAFFIGLHIVQTKVAYDGLAQDVHILTSMGSVVILLVVVLMMENQRRGLVFGKKLPLSQEVVRALRKYHGYYFSWAIIYTFWYHPIETTYGHLLGLFYTFLLMLQGSLFFTRTHTNKWWTMAMEFFVVVHGTMVAYVATMAGESEGGSPGQFLFGFLLVFVITQMHGLGLSKKIRWFIAAVFVALMGFYYFGRWAEMVEVPRVAMIEYPAILVIGLITWMLIRLAVLLRWLIARVAKPVGS